MVSRLLPALILTLAVWSAPTDASAQAPDPATAPPGPRDLASPQTAPSPEIRTVAALLRGPTDEQSLRAAMAWIVENLAYDPGLNAEQFDRSAADVFRERTMGGCSEFALALLALARAMDIPSRLVLSVNAAWIAAWKKNPYAVPNGHSFLEVWLDGAWRLADPTAVTLYDRHDPSARCLPHGEFLMARGADFWSLGLTGVPQVQRMLEQAARDAPPAWLPPASTPRFEARVDFVKAFLAQGRIFLERGKPNMALRLARKTLEIAPGAPEALLLRAGALLDLGDCAGAGADLAALTARGANLPGLGGLARRVQECAPATGTLP